MVYLNKVDTFKLIGRSCGLAINVIRVICGSFLQKFCNVEQVQSPSGGSVTIESPSIVGWIFFSFYPFFGYLHVKSNYYFLANIDVLVVVMGTFASTIFITLIWHSSYITLMELWSALLPLISNSRKVCYHKISLSLFRITNNSNLYNHKLLLFAQVVI